MDKPKEKTSKPNVKLAKWLACTPPSSELPWGSRETYERGGIIYEKTTGRALGRIRAKTGSRGAPCTFDLLWTQRKRCIQTYTHCYNQGFDRQAKRPPGRAGSGGSSVRTRSSRAGTVASSQGVDDFEITEGGGVEDFEITEGAGVEANADDDPAETTTDELVALDSSGEGAG
ncbi:hypothetical protein PV10_03935 [Exophiala mesophila]|uniref:Uncharacterized protein n=1 Tax=Exophiala mesophila TaxID=212818 RepID=A0A0D1ZD97_EXOME|nr:uncharacterized protein PV10_03935 [Exophiala mesophila]KIV92662.1 hypothetical protein PV10_03935 [Exophiala mesophila]